MDKNIHGSQTRYVTLSRWIATPIRDSTLNLFNVALWPRPGSLSHNDCDGIMIPCCIVTTGHDSMLHCDYWSWFHVALWLLVMIPCSIVTRVIILHLIKIRSQFEFHIAFWPRFKIPLRIVTQIEITRWIVAKVKSLPGHNLTGHN